MILSSGQAYSYPMREHMQTSQLGLSDDGGEVWKAHQLCETAVIETHDKQPMLKSIWNLFPGFPIKTYLIPPFEATPNWHIRVHRIETGRKLMTVDGAFAIWNERKSDGRSFDIYDARKNEGTMPKIIGNYNLDIPKSNALGSVGAFAVSKGTIGIAALENDNGSLCITMFVNANLNSNLVGNHTMIPTLQITLESGPAAWFVTDIYAKLSGEAIGYFDRWKNIPVILGWLMNEMCMRDD
ncbi:hypothetical protein DSL72_008982 [Monilinia vaccinii-corymbosi]|uniref:DUF2264 domain-containing protein n=1 Tax=Monilinia vaccinii-corymbosi TaxID=61207 RepID=A0A8A3PQP9_9HELO|nr:hypothetical protein DSL72_008982 [Monilinia vaccinii-corymbosi]